MNQKILTLLLRKFGLTVEVGANGAEAIQLATSSPDRFRLILMDVQMPILSGLDATRALRKAGYSAPIIAVTANATIEDRESCERAGTDDFLCKPVKPHLLYAMLDQYGVPVPAQSQSAAR